MITTGSGADVIVYNLGDGHDTVNVSNGLDNTVSIGMAKYIDLLFGKSGNDLQLKVGAGQIDFKDWYAPGANHSVKTLQVVIEGTSDYNAAGDALHNKKIEQFDFSGLTNAYDQARAANSALNAWAISGALLNFHLAGSDTAAIGGDLAYQYARRQPG